MAKEKSRRDQVEQQTDLASLFQSVMEAIEIHATFVMGRAAAEALRVPEQGHQ